MYLLYPWTNCDSKEEKGANFILMGTQNEPVPFLQISVQKIELWVKDC